ncbi:uncharacterized protein TNCV_4893151 [Trichonephila clavipes]|nr:uncharacterized protein TNCV_4893151 [Trichonephila clavipes]
MAKSRSGRSKKRRFTGNRYTIRATINENDETSELNSTESASAKKVGIKPYKFPYDREDERFLSYKLFNCFGAKDNRERIFSWQKLCAFLGLPFLSKLAFRNQERKLLKATERVAEENINAALSEIKGSNSFTKCGISIDGTWQRRGYSSLNGCVSAISVDTGKILDIEVMTQYCHICAKGNSQSSKHVCSNYKGSAGNMEVVGAYRIFERSNVRNVQYNEYYGDGDPKGYESVKTFYGINTVTKLECIGHVQKRVGGRLRQLKKRRKCPEGSESWCRYQRAKAAGSPLKEIEQGLPNKIINQIKPTYLKLCNETLLKNVFMELWFQQDGATCHTARATIDLLKDTFGDRLISRFGPVNWPSRSCDLTPLDYFLWGYVISLVYADKPQTLDHLEDNIRRVIADIRPQMLEKSSNIGRPDWTTSKPAVAILCQKSYLKCNATR